MKLSPALTEAYTRERYSARQAQERAEWIAFGPIVFQVSRVMLRWGILERLRNSDGGLTIGELAAACGKSEYAIKVLMEASLSIGTVLVDPATERFTLSKTGWFLLNDPATRVNVDFNHDVNYEGWFKLEQALDEGKPAGLRHFGSWPTIYEGLSSLPAHVRRSWLAFDHFYSDSAFAAALDIVFALKPSTILDVGGNTGRWALQCVARDPNVNVTIMDLPQQIEMMEQATAGKPGAERIDAFATDLLERSNSFPTNRHYDVIWMSQFLDCFGEDEILSILRRAAAIMDEGSRLCIMETLWDRQRFEPAAFCLTMTSLYFTALANGNSRMYNTDDLTRLIAEAGLEVEQIHDGLGQGHSIVVCRKPSL